MRNSGRSAISRAVVRVGLAALVASPTVLSHPVEARIAEVDLRDGADVVIVGAGDRDMAGLVSYAGDINGDGIPDFLVSSCVSPHQRVSSGSTFVVFGVRNERRTVELDGGSGDYGFRIDGAGQRDYACHASGVGDVNGDGFDDIAIGASGADNRGRTDSGSSYVIFGKPTTSPVNLALFDLDMQEGLGFRIDGPGAFALAGRDVAGAGDVNQDGLDDILVGAPGAGSTYLVFGKHSTVAVDLSDFHGEDVTDGIRISHPRPDDPFLFAVAGLGDVNRDGTPDVGVGLTPTDRHPGFVYAIFGRSSPGQINARRLGNRGFRITGARAGDATGLGLDGAGDVNGDGFDDLIVGASRVYDAQGSGSAYVVFGGPKPRSLQLSQLDSRGFRIRGTQSGDAAGLSVAAAGDVNGDGLQDVLVGAPDAWRPDRGSAEYGDSPGAAFVVFGKKTLSTVQLRTLGRHGYRINGAEASPDQCDEGISHSTTGPIEAYFCEGDSAGVSVAPAGDVNGDGLADILVGATMAGDPYPGQAYLIWSHPFLARRSP